MCSRLGFAAACVLAASMAVAQKETAASAVEADLGDIFSDASKWSLASDAFVEDYRALGFRFVDSGRQAAVSNRKASLRFLGLDVYEARVYFDAAAVRRVELSLYNKGDAGEKDRERFEALVAAAKQKIEACTKDPGMTGKTSNERANYFVKRHQWTKKSPAILLEWAYVETHRSERQNVPYGAEYIKVLMVTGGACGGAAGVGGGMAANRPKSARTIRENVAHGTNGDVVIENVPMVDQGQKGYCAAASSERVLRYYGIEVDQHQVAQLANTAAEGGTTLEGMARAIARIGRQFQLDKRDLISPDSGGSFEKSDHAKLIDQYNAMAKRRKGKPIDWQAYVQNHVVDLQAIWCEMDPEILLAARGAQKQAMGQFVKAVKTYVDPGVPLLWSCLVGMYPEEPPLGQEGAFGHVRLIIGYNDKTQEVLYSDSWGPRHALKRLPVDNAWAMTKGLIVLKPHDVR